MAELSQSDKDLIDAIHDQDHAAADSCCPIPTGESDRPTWQDAVRDYFDPKGEADNQWWEDIIEHAERKMNGESD